MCSDEALAGPMPAPVTTLCPDKIYAVGGYIRADRTLSWIDRNAKGWLPCQCYVLISGEDFLLVDTGLVVHQASIRTGIASLVGGSLRRSVMLTRREPDTMMNLPWIVREFGIQSVRCCGPIDPFDLVERLDEAHTSAQIKASLGITVDFLTPNATVAFGGFEIEVIRPSIRILATDWMYEKSTKTLFTSDTWAFLTRPQPGDAIIVSPSDADISADNIRNHLRAKFDWLCGIDTRPIADNLRSIMAARQVDRICPSYGCAIEGREAVIALLARTTEALEQLSREKRPSPMKQFFNRRPGDRSECANLV